MESEAVKYNKMLSQRVSATLQEHLPDTKNQTGGASCQKQEDNDIFIKDTETKSKLGTHINYRQRRK